MRRSRTSTRSRAIAVVDYFTRTLSKTQSVNSGFIIWIADPILPVWFCNSKIRLIFGFGYTATTRLPHPIYYLCIFSFSFSLPRRNSDPGSLSRLFSPLPTMLRAFILIAIRHQPFLPSLTNIELIAPTDTVINRRSQQLIPLIFYFCK